MRVSLSLAALECDLELVQSRFFFFRLRLGSRTDSQSERGGGQSDTLNAEGGEIRQEQVFFLSLF